ncbi:uncharacterized protein IL334_004660 [Kwoniella shivajii]|uniref:Major facilitator superfamily (MFS) profile domain-containing protein n=1 Tax=Kwoniella shivajii TaxID=564305 RepID=A0ABZ1D0Z0_9TREE|nr:hypothetical protein IL334_004660 [Kwoniella shivajii]
MMETIRDSSFGLLLRIVTRPHRLSYIEERNDFVTPKLDRSANGSAENTSVDQSSCNNTSPDTSTEIVTWYADNDNENPRNWSLFKKSYVTSLIMLLTSTVYLGSAIYAPASESASEFFNISTTVSSLGVSLFVAGYGIGPLFLSGITEIPIIGRTPIYIITLVIFLIVQILTATVNNFAGFCILRFIAGFMGSPALASGGASLDDMFPAHKLAYSMGLWGLSAEAAPALAPIVSSFAVEAKGWTWAFWEMTFLSGFCLIVLFFTLPETSPDTILLRRAQRIRLKTGNSKYQSESEITHSSLSFSDILFKSLLRPLSLTFTEPIIIAINLYIGLVYATLYSFFESFPLLYEDGYGWDLGISTLPFAALFIGSFLGFTIYCTWNWIYIDKPYDPKETSMSLPETRLPLALFGAFCFPVCIFLLAWTAVRTHWIVPISAGIPFGIGSTLVFNPFLTYLPYAYPQYAASALASNDFFRSMMGAGMPVVAHPLFGNLGIDWGNTLIGILTVCMIPIPFALYRAGPWLRRRSKIAL